MIIKHVHIDKFRALENIDFDLGSKITAIVGHNGTMKTTMLGILSQPFSLSDKTHPMYGEKAIDGFNYKSQFGEKFKLSSKDIPGEHKWHLDLYDGIYKDSFIELISIVRDKTSGKIRFWSTEGKQKGMNSAQIPVYYLSLKRVTPIGEEDKLSVDNPLQENEIAFLHREYKKIFSYTDKTELNTELILSKNKKSAAIYTDQYDAFTISAGQDNIGKILLVVLSFKRLMEKYKDEYKGGLILIDEIESTCHPSAQRMLIERLYSYARDFKIQFIFSTHSPTVIKSAFFDNYNKRDAKLIYLKKVGEKVKTYETPSINSVIAELSGEVLTTQTKKNTKINVFCEDAVGRNIARELLSSYKDRYHMISCDLGAEEYIELIKAKVPNMNTSIFVLDGDKNTNRIRSKLEKCSASNVVFLPSYSCPEKMFYEYLMSLQEEDPFWNNNLGGFDKAKCFLGYVELKDETNNYKKWFDSVKKHFGKSYKRLVKYWIQTNEDEYRKFIESFVDAYNNVAERQGIETISIN